VLEGGARTPWSKPAISSGSTTALREHLPSFIERAEASGASLPLFAVNDLEGVLPTTSCRRCCIGSQVLSFQTSMAVRLGYDAKLLARVSRSLTRRIMGQIRRRVKQHHELRSVGTCTLVSWWSCSGFAPILVFMYIFTVW
jgi:hypothetical protein